MPENPTHFLAFLKVSRQSFKAIEPPIQGSIIDEMIQCGSWYMQLCLSPERHEIGWKEAPEASYFLADATPEKQTCFISHIFASEAQGRQWYTEFSRALAHCQDQAMIKYWHRQRTIHVVVKTRQASTVAHYFVFGSQAISERGETIGNLLADGKLLLRKFNPPLVIAPDYWNSRSQGDIHEQVIWTEDPQQYELYISRPSNRITADNFPAVTSVPSSPPPSSAMNSADSSP